MKADRRTRRSTIGRFLLEARLKAGLSQGAISRALGYTTPQFVSNWERGVAIPPLETLPRLAAMLQISAEDMIAVYQVYEGKEFERRKAMISRFLRRKCGEGPYAA